MNIVDPILFHARLNPAAPAICVPGAARPLISYGRLEQAIHNISRAALSAGLARGQVAAIHVADKIFHAALILGLARIGVVSLSARSHSLPKEIGVDAVIADVNATSHNARRVIAAAPDAWMQDGDGAPLADARLAEVGGDDLCRITLTSGSTGEARGIAFTHRDIAARNARLSFVRGNRFPLCTRFYCELGMATDPGYRDMVHMLTKGGTIFYYGEDAEGMIQALGLYRVDGMIVSPQGLVEYLKFYEAYPNLPCGLDFILTSGAALTRALSDRVRTRMCSGLFSTYGATETGGVAVAPAHAIAEIPGAVGYVVPGATVEIVDGGDRALPLGREGTVRIRTAVKGYMGNPPEAQSAFRDGWFYPGDIGVLQPDGILIVLGRERSLLNLGGDKVRPELLEDVLASHPSVAQAAVFTHADELGIARLWAAVVPRTRLDEEALRRHCAQKLGGAFAPAHFAVADALPLTEGGKLDRSRLAALASPKGTQR
jgi:acyl-CoA synthetase (AMP-forming)/AMP-acid ligase II